MEATSSRTHPKLKLKAKMKNDEFVVTLSSRSLNRNSDTLFFFSEGGVVACGVGDAHWGWLDAGTPTNEVFTRVSLSHLKLKNFYSSVNAHIKIRRGGERERRGIT